MKYERKICTECCAETIHVAVGEGMYCIRHEKPTKDIIRRRIMENIYSDKNPPERLYSVVLGRRVA